MTEVALPDLDPAALAEAEREMLELIVELEKAGALTDTQLDLSAAGDISYETYEALGTFFGRVKRHSSWWIGDWINWGEGLWGERFAQALHETKLEEQTLLNYSYVCRQIPNERRLAGVSFSVHAEVAPLTPREQRSWLKKAAEGGWTQRELRARMKAKRSEQHPVPPPDPEVSPGLIEEIARAILRDASEHPDDASLMCVPRDDIARLEAALGGE